MSRSNYSDELDDNWQLIRWRGAVKKAVYGKRGQALLKELEAALLALPEKKLLAFEFAASNKTVRAYAGSEDEATEGVCALGAVLLKRETDKGLDREAALQRIEEKLPEGTEPEDIAEAFGVAEALVRELMFFNDEETYDKNPEARYERMLATVREMIVKGQNKSKV